MRRIAAACPTARRGLRTRTSTNGECPNSITAKRSGHSSYISTQPLLCVCFSPVFIPFYPHLSPFLFPLLFPMHPLFLQARNEGVDRDGENLCGGAAVCFAGNGFNVFDLICFQL